MKKFRKEEFITISKKDYSNLNFRTITELQILNLAWLQLVEKLNHEETKYVTNPSEILENCINKNRAQEREIHARILELEKEKRG